MIHSKIHALEKDVARSAKIVSAILVLALLCYASWSWLYRNHALSTQSTAGGEFGGFVGGILSLVFALSAFYWLTRSVLLQKEELLETRPALQDSAKLQARHTTIAGASRKMSILTALLNSVVSEAASLRSVDDELAG